jgi:hypothetical protein
LTISKRDLIEERTISCIFLQSESPPQTSSNDIPSRVVRVSKGAEEMEEETVGGADARFEVLDNRDERGRCVVVRGDKTCEERRNGVDMVFYVRK